MRCYGKFTRWRSQISAERGVSFTIMKIIFVTIILLLFLSACASNAPSKGTKYCKMKNISEIEGNYINRGNGDIRINGQQIHLSQIIWPEDDQLNLEQHRSIEAISISTNTFGKVSFSAHANHSEIISGAPEHLQVLEEGIVPLHKSSTIWPGLGVVVGLKSSKLFLFQDCNKNLVLGRNSIQTGLVYLLIPASFSFSDTVIFEKTSQANKSFKNDALKNARVLN